MAVEAAAKIMAIHSNFLFALPEDISNTLQAGAPAPSDLSDLERRALDKLRVYFTKNAGYAIEMATRPNATDSPIRRWPSPGLDDRPRRRRDRPAGGDGPEGDAHADQGTAARSGLTRDDVLDNITLYWLTNTGVSRDAATGTTSPLTTTPKSFSIPAAFTVFPGEIYQPSRALGGGRLLEPLLLPTTWTRAGASRRGKSHCSSRRRCARRSSRCGRSMSCGGWRASARVIRRPQLSQAKPQSYAVTYALRITRRAYATERINYGFAAGAPPQRQRLQRPQVGDDRRHVLVVDVLVPVKSHRTFHRRAARQQSATSGRSERSATRRTLARRFLT